MKACLQAVRQAVTRSRRAMKIKDGMMMAPHLLDV